MDQVLTFSYRGTNLGDDVQTIAQMDLFPRGTEFSFVERDSLRAHKGGGKLILNGWWSHNPAMAWPPPDDVDALPVSMHITPKARHVFGSPDSIEWFKRNGPIGARDLETLEWLRSIGVDAYWSGCLTLTLKRPSVGHGSEVLLVDLKGEHRSELDGMGGIDVTHTSKKGYPQRLHDARKLLWRYASAKLVVTSRLHVALPCAAMGTPCVLVGDNIRFQGFEKVMPITSTNLRNEVDKVLDSPFERSPETIDMTEALRERCRNFIAR